jgi:hypothetical protein
VTAEVAIFSADRGLAGRSVLRPIEQQQMSDYVFRLLASIDQGEGT